MNVLNLKARCLRNTIEAEKGRNNPNQEVIRELEKELKMTLRELKWK